MFENKRIIIAVSGSIAAYKAADIVSWLAQNGADVKVAMTRSAEEFITPLTLKTLSGKKVLRNTVDDEFLEEDIAGCDLFLVLPATANIIAKAAHGISDDLVSRAISAAKSPLLFFPAMHCNMYANPLTQKNISILKDRGVYFIEPASGHLACGAEGKGRLAGIDDIKAAISRFLFFDRQLSGIEVLVTAGPTRERIDPARYLSNFSSGKMGYALAALAFLKGAKVNLISGPTCLSPPLGVNVIYVETAKEMLDAVESHFDTADIVIKAAAVSDYRASNTSTQKLKKERELELILSANPDILLSLGEKKGEKILIGFAAETENLRYYAEKKLKEKNLDMIIANNIALEGAGFESDTNIISIITENFCIDLPKMSKTEAASKIFEAIGGLPRFLDIKQKR